MEALAQAKGFLNVSHSWKRYLDQVQKNTPLKASDISQNSVLDAIALEGTFAQVLRQQRKTLNINQPPFIDDPSEKVVVAESLSPPARAPVAADPQTPTR